MSALRLFLFGAPRLEQDGTSLVLRRSKVLALLGYLATMRQPQERDMLAALLWSEFGMEAARNNLRRELSTLKGMLGQELLVADRQQVALRPEADLWVDLSEFREQLDRSQAHGHAPDGLCSACSAALETAARLYVDDFLAGFSLADCPAFEEWQFFQREELRHQLAGVLQRLIQHASARHEHGNALPHARRWVALDPLHEPAQRELMRLYAEAGQQAAALRQYDECARLLDELGVEPDAETTALYTEIRARRVGPPRPAVRPAPAATRLAARQPAHALPSPPGFVGRKHELAEILGRLTDRDCRLLTLTGPGGIGKTRLAIEAARIVARDWTGEHELADGVIFIPLVAASTASSLYAAIAEAAGFEFAPSVAPRQHVLDYFRARRMLLVFDNFEQLLGAEGAPEAFVGELIARAPGLRLLVTSRTSLSLQDEWFHPVDGLSFPTPDDETGDLDGLARYDAIRLFEQHARRVKSDFQLAPQREQVVMLCRLVEGMPLAIELAAGWLRVLAADQVIAELQRGLAILTSRDRDIPERHRSIRAVMEQSWALLSQAEQQTLACLAVFAGLGAAAAEAVAGASLDMLAALVEKSLLRSTAGGRFHMHELVRQFAAEKLAADPRLARDARERHCDYFLGFLERYDAPMVAEEQPAALPELAHDVENVRAAWLWATEHGQVARIDRALASCFVFYATRHFYQQGEELLSRALALVDGPPAPDQALIYARVRGGASIRRGALRYLLGDYEHAVDDVERGLDQANALGLDGDCAYALLLLGMIAGWRGDVANARQRLEQTLARGKAIGDQPVITQALVESAWNASAEGDYAQTRQLAQEGRSIARATGRIDQEAQALRQLAWAAVSRGELNAADAYYRESLVLFERLGSQIGVLQAYGGLGWVAWCAGGARLPEARAHLERSLAGVRQLGRRLMVTNYLGDLGLVALDRGEYGQARDYAEEGLAIARELGSATYTAYHLSILAHVELAEQDFAASRRGLSEALRAASASGLWPMLALVLYYVALLSAHEADASGVEPAAAAGSLARALELLASIAHNPATWHAFRHRARRMIEDLRHRLPDDAARAALDRGRELDWQTSVTALSDDLSRAAR